MNATFKTIMLWMSLLVVIFLAWHFAQIQKKETTWKFSEFLTQVEQGSVLDSKKTVGALLSAAGVTVTAFTRFEVGTA